MRTDSLLLSPKLILPLLYVISAAIYWPGFYGDFVFDDGAHISRNDLIAITEFSVSQLYQAWNASPFDFPSSRPLSMLTFGLNHLFTGLDAFWFKFTNLMIHLLCGMAVYRLAVLLAGSLGGAVLGKSLPVAVKGVAYLVTAFWLLAPINLSPVLYVVQRMTSLSTLFILFSLIAYAQGRIALIQGRFDLASFLSVPLLAGIAFLAKEIAVLVPLYLLVIETTIFRFQTEGESGKRALNTIILVCSGIPLLCAAGYVLSQPDFFENGYVTRSFTLEQRLLTELRVIWFYIGQIIAPNLSQLAFHHDDLMLSTGFFKPVSTILSLLGIVLTVLFSFLVRNRFPAIAFGFLFFFAGHVLESTALALEPVFEHRNYLPSFGLFFALSYIIICMVNKSRYKLLSGLLLALFLVYPAAITSLRAVEWGDPELFTVMEALRKPGSARANFRAGRMMVGRLDTAENQESTYAQAKGFFMRTINSNERNADGLFGLIVLNLHVNREPEFEWIEELKRRLSVYPFSPMNVTTEHFSYLVRWQMSDGHKMKHETLVGIFDAVLGNPDMDGYARAGILNALRAYYQDVQKDPEYALPYAEEAVQHYPRRWHYNMKLIKLLGELNRFDDADVRLKNWVAVDVEQLHEKQTGDLKQWLKRMKVENSKSR
jgi:tetratricopeptide (TPR) repeat protein